MPQRDAYLYGKTNGIMDVDLSKFDFNVEKLGDCQVPSPLRGERLRFVEEDERIVVVSDLKELSAYQEKQGTIPSMETAGPREKIFHPEFTSINWTVVVAQT
ncbi:hypothetical protein MLD52_20960 [Puniceicoccaceae bacterium K14]|nr:hypothetical protein [Puniceicoccaceae bacterium K14]